jgi:CelD/BcsL family acetyltransferase involved in cellulose biosynthesis
MSDLRIEEVTTLQGLEALAPAWADLWRQAPAATPFQAPAWLIPWWRHLGQGELVVLCAFEADRLSGLLPLYIHDERRWRKLLPVGIGNSDWLDALCLPGRELEVAAALLSAIAGQAAHFDVCDLQPLPPESPLLQADAAGLEDERALREPCPVLLLPAGAPGYESALPKAMAQNLRYYRRRAEKAGRLDFEVADPGSLGALLDALCVLHRRRWQRQGFSGVLADGAVRAFHEQAAPALMALGVLRLYALRLDQRIVAVLYGFMAKGRFYHYLAGFDPDLGRLGLGTLVIGYALAQAAAEEVRAFDFLRGREAYKYRWGARDRPSYGRRLWARG